MLSRAVYLVPRPEFQREWIFDKFYYTISTGVFSWKGYKLYFSQSEMLTSNVQLGYVLTRGGGKLSRVVYLAPAQNFNKPAWTACPPTPPPHPANFITPATTGIFSWKGHKLPWDAYFKCSVGLRIDKGWGAGASCPGRFILPPA